MADFKICIGLYRVEGLLGGDLRSLLDVVRDADQAGIDQVTFPDHVELALFRDSDDTGAKSTTYFSEIRVEARP